MALVFTAPPANRNPKTLKPTASYSKTDDESFKVVYVCAVTHEPHVSQIVQAAIEHMLDSTDWTAVERAVQAGNAESAYYAIAAATQTDGLFWLFKKGLANTLSATFHALIPSLAQRLTALEVRKAAKKKPTQFSEPMQFAEPQAETTQTLLGADLQATNPKAMEWVDQHAGELVTAITEQTRQNIKNIIGQSVQGQLTVPATIKAIRGSVGLNGPQQKALTNWIAANPDKDPTPYSNKLRLDRANMIARTETIAASNKGQEALWSEAADKGFLNTKQVRRVWILTPGACAICQAEAEMTAELGEKFLDFEGPPAHPSCRCAEGLELNPNFVSETPTPDKLAELPDEDPQVKAHNGYKVGDEVWYITKKGKKLHAIVENYGEKGDLVWLHADKQKDPFVLHSDNPNLSKVAETPALDTAPTAPKVVTPTWQETFLADLAHAQELGVIGDEDATWFKGFMVEQPEDKPGYDFVNQHKDLLQDIQKAEAGKIVLPEFVDHGWDAVVYNFKKLVTPEEDLALKLYKGQWWSSINTYLRTGELVSPAATGQIPAEADVKKYIASIDSAMQKAPLSDSIVLHRGMFFSKAQGNYADYAKWADLKPGEVVHQDTYLSTSHSTDQAGGFGATSINSTNEAAVHLILNTPKGVHGIPIDQFGITQKGPLEQEVLLERGLDLKVLKVVPTGTGSVDVVVEAIPQPQAPTPAEPQKTPETAPIGQEPTVTLPGGAEAHVGELIGVDYMGGPEYKVLAIHPDGKIDVEDLSSGTFYKSQKFEYGTYKVYPPDYQAEAAPPPEVPSAAPEVLPAAPPEGPAKFPYPTTKSPVPAEQLMADFPKGSTVLYQGEPHTVVSYKSTKAQVKVQAADGSLKEVLAAKLETPKAEYQGQEVKVGDEWTHTNGHTMTVTAVHPDGSVDAVDTTAGGAGGKITSYPAKWTDGWTKTTSGEPETTTTPAPVAGDYQMGDTVQTVNGKTYELLSGNQGGIYGVKDLATGEETTIYHSEITEQGQAPVKPPRPVAPPPAKYQPGTYTLAKEGINEGSKFEITAVNPDGTYVVDVTTPVGQHIHHNNADEGIITTTLAAYPEWTYEGPGEAPSFGVVKPVTEAEKGDYVVGPEGDSYKVLDKKVEDPFLQINKVLLENWGYHGAEGGWVQDQVLDQSGYTAQTSKPPPKTAPAEEQTAAPAPPPQQPLEPAQQQKLEPAPTSTKYPTTKSSVDAKQLQADFPKYSKVQVDGVEHTVLGYKASKGQLKLESVATGQVSEVVAGKAVPLVQGAQTLAPQPAFEPPPTAKLGLPDIDKLVEVPMHLEGAHKKTVYKDPETGVKWMFKPDPDPITSVAEKVGNDILATLDLPSPEIYVTKIGGKLGSLQAMYEDYTPIRLNALSQLTPDQIAQVQRHQVADWLMSQHDTNDGAMLLLKTGQVLAIDKGQAFKFFGKDKLTADYNPNQNPLVYQRLYLDAKAGKVQLSWAAIEPTIRKVEALSDQQIRDLVKPYGDQIVNSEFRRDTSRQLFKTSEDFQNAVVERAHNLRRDFNALYKAADIPVLAEPLEPAPVIVPTGALTKVDPKFVENYHTSTFAGQSIMLAGPDLEDAHVLAYNIKKGGQDILTLEGKVRPESQPLLEAKLKLKLPAGGGTAPVNVDPIWDPLLAGIKTIGYHLGPGKDGAVNESTLQKMQLAASKVKAEADPDMKTHYNQIFEETTGHGVDEIGSATSAQFVQWVKDHGGFTSGTSYTQYIPPKPKPVAGKVIPWTPDQPVLHPGEVVSQVAPFGPGLHIADQVYTVVSAQGDTATIKTLDGYTTTVKATTLGRQEGNVDATAPANDPIVTQVTPYRLATKINPADGTISTTGAEFREQGGVAYKVDLGEGITAVYIPHHRLNPYSKVGRLTLYNEAAGPITPEKMLHTVEQLRRVGLDVNFATPEDLELVYLQKVAHAAKYDTDDPAYKAVTAKWSPTTTTGDKINSLIDYWKTKLGQDPRSLPSYKPLPQFDTHPDPNSSLPVQRPYWTRFDISLDQLKKEMPDYILNHGLNGSGSKTPEAIRDFWIGVAKAHTGWAMNTEERKRVGVAGSGASSSADEGTGGASYLFTRIRKPGNLWQNNYGGMNHGVADVLLSPELLLRTDTISYSSDTFGDTHPERLRGRGSTTAQWKSFSGNSGNETNVKNGFNIFDYALRINGGKYRQEIIDAFKANGINTIRGVPVEEVVVGNQRDNNRP